MTIKSQPLDFAVSIIAVAGCAFGTCNSSADIPSHSSSFIEHFARTFLAGCVKAIKLFLPRESTAPKGDRQRFRYGDDCRFSVQGLCQSNPMLNAFSRDIRSIRAHENIGVHSGAPLLVEHFF